MITKMFKPPARPTFFDDGFGRKSIFLAGSIEMGKAVDWQLLVQEKLEHLDVLMFNPRRDDWDSTWEQTKENENFRGQVEWELDMLERCSLIMMYLDPASTSPISLLELGLYASTGKLIVCCPKGFYRKGNVDIVCQRYGILMVETLDELINLARWKLK